MQALNQLGYKRGQNQLEKTTQMVLFSPFFPLIAERAASQRPNAELQRKNALEALPIDGKLLIQEDNQVKIISPQILGSLHLNESC